MKPIHTFNLAGIAFLAALIGCSLSQNTDYPAIPTTNETQTFEQQEPTEVPQTPSPLPNSDYDVLSLWVAPHLPAAAQSQLAVPPEFSLTDQIGDAVFRLDVGEQNIISRWAFALVAPFPTLPDGVSSQELRQTWAGSPSGPFIDHPILMDQNTLDLFSL